MADDGTVSARYLVSGRVQGVGFRWFVHRRASRLGLAGWVTNLRDGQVEVAVCGHPSAVRSLESALTTGPPLAHVENVEKAVIPHDVVNSNAFEIR